LDFQNAPQIASGNCGVLSLRRCPTIVSQRFIQLILDNELNGLDQNGDDVKLPFLVPDITP
jgi:hypothetical protein